MYCERDRDAATWTIPAARMKARRDHQVQLSARALGGGTGLVFLSARVGWVVSMEARHGR